MIELNLERKILPVLSFLVLCYFLGGSNAASFEEDLTLTMREKYILDQFKALVADRMPQEYMKKDVYLIRWLRARYFNIKEAENMLMKNLEWREINGMDTIRQEDLGRFSDNKYYIESLDREGKPMLYLNIGSWDLRKIVVAGEAEKFMRYIYQGLEEGCSQVRERGEKYHNVSQGMLILNADGFNMVQHGCLRCIPLFLRIIFDYEAHYPGCANTLFAINVPTIAEPIVQAARGALHPITNKSLKVFTTNRRKWQEALDYYFSRDELPVELGGTKVYKGMDVDY